MANINEFKSRLRGGGARANQFKVVMPFPGFAQVGGEIETLAFMCRATQLPGFTVSEVPVNFRGRPIYIAGDRTFETWPVTVYNDTDFLTRNAFERWSNGINNMSDNEGLTNPADYQVDAFVEQLDRAGEVIKGYTFRGLWPLTIAPIELAYDGNDAVEEFEVTYRYQFFETNTTT